MAATLDQSVKKEIQDGYSRFLEANDLRPRLGQKQMIAVIANVLCAIREDADGHRQSGDGGEGICVVEAGTGTGKTLAYLLAVLPIARQKKKRVVLATGTIVLQEQLIDKDIPALLKHTGWDYSVAVAKGRGRYLCPLKLEQCLDAADSQQSGQFLFEDELAFNPSERNIATYREMAEALEKDEWNGDRDNWNASIAHVDWQPLTVDRRQCAGRRCRYIRECCFFKARDELEEADCIVANHDLVMADLALGGGVILPPPEDTIYIFDEGHRLADTALKHFSGVCRLNSTQSWLAKLIKQVESRQAQVAVINELAAGFEKLSVAAIAAEKALALSYPIFDQLVQDNMDLDSGDDQPTWCFPNGDPGADIRLLANELAETLSYVGALLKQLSDHISSSMEDVNAAIPRVDLEQLLQLVGIWQGRLDSALGLWRQYAIEDDPKGPPDARWLALEQSGGSLDICVSAAPTRAASIFQERLWQRCYGAVITSATLQALGNFDRFRQGVGTPVKANYVSVAGAFDYPKVGVLSVPNIGAEGNQAQAHTEALIEKLADFIDQDEGTLVLFSSRRQMEQVYEGIPIDLEQRVLMQGKWSNKEIISRHKAAIDDGEGSIIFGLASFAEGMDFPGDYCRHVIIAKIPFSVPNDPVHDTLSEWVENRGGNSFMELMLPDASLRLNQACGRLLRTETDTGRVTILDRRVITKRYGQQLLNALPPFRREIA